MIKRPTSSRFDGKPLLGVVACNRRVGDEIGASVMHRYLVAAARHANASLMIVPSLPDLIDAPRLIAAMDGLLLTGSPSNVRPTRYGDHVAGEGPFDDGRDETALKLIDAASEAGKPILGICRGLQEINVALGGTLRRDLKENPGLMAHHASDNADLDGMFSHRHEVKLTKGGVLAQAIGAERATVSSVHYQAIDWLAPGLFVEARAADDLVEAVSADLGGASLIAVQWHPEWRADQDIASQAIFGLFGRMMRGAPMSARA